MLVPFAEYQCFFVVILGFIALGFQRGWRRELVSLVFVLLAVFLMRPDSSRTVVQFLERIPSTFIYLATGSASETGSSATPVGIAPWGALIGFILIVIIGYLVGNKAFPKPTTPYERFIGVVPAVVSGAFVLAYIANFIPKSAGQPQVQFTMQAPDPGNYVAVIFMIALVAVLIALIAARAKKSVKK